MPGSAAQRPQVAGKTLAYRSFAQSPAVAPSPAARLAPEPVLPQSTVGQATLRPRRAMGSGSGLQEKVAQVEAFYQSTFAFSSR